MFVLAPLRAAKDRAAAPRTLYDATAAHGVRVAQNPSTILRACPNSVSLVCLPRRAMSMEMDGTIDPDVTTASNA